MNYEYQPTCQIPPETLDKIYMDAFGYKTDGVLVEFGAHDGWHWSATWGLAKIGWRSIYCEPDIVLYRQCLETHKDRPNVSVLHCCVGRENGSVTLGEGLYGATKESSKATFVAQQVTLDTLLSSQDIKPGFDLLVIDVEGMEADVLAGFTLAKWTPKLVIIERPPVPNCFTEAGYEKKYEDWINSVFLKQ